MSVASVYKHCDHSTFKITDSKLALNENAVLFPLV